MGCGKSTVSEILRNKLYYVLDMDSTIKQMYYKDNGTKNILCQVFGNEAVKDYDKNENTCPPNMEYLRQEMFKPENTEKRKLLMHRILTERLDPIIFFEKYDDIYNKPIVFVEAALTESIAEFIDVFKVKHIINIQCADHIRRQRLHGRGMTDEDIDNRSRLQHWPVLPYGIKTHIITNDGSADDLALQVDYLLGDKNFIYDTTRLELFKYWLHYIPTYAVDNAICGAFKTSKGCKNCPFPCKEWLNKKDKNDK
jgi:dephospho-CoA kinase